MAASAHARGARTAPRIAAVAAVLLIAVLGLRALDLRSDTGLPVGANDYIAFWAAFDVAVDGDDPYDPEVLRQAQLDQDPRFEEGAQRFWSPPWTLLVLAPVLALPFEVSTATWLVLSAAAGVLCAAISWRLFVRRDEPAPPVVLGASLLFVPFFETLLVGQLGVLVALLVLGGLLALRDERDTAAGVLLALTAVKPQATLLVLLVIGVHVVATRRWTVVRAAVYTTAALVTGSLLLLPNVWAGWSPLGGSPTHWHTATIAGWIRWALSAAGEGAPTWPVVAVPLVVGLSVLPWAIRHRSQIVWPALPGVMTLSVLAAPYAWIPDSMLALPVQVVVLGMVVHRVRAGMFWFGALLVGQAGVLWMRSWEETGLQHLALVPVLLLLVHVLSARWTPLPGPDPTGPAEQLLSGPAEPPAGSGAPAPPSR